MPLRVVNPNDGKHFRDRLFQRFGILLTASDMWPLRDQLKTAQRVEWDPQTGIAVYLMRIQAKPMHVVYDTRKQWFVTANFLNHVESMVAARV